MAFFVPGNIAPKVVAILREIQPRKRRGTTRPSIIMNDGTIRCARKTNRKQIQMWGDSGHDGLYVRVETGRSIWLIDAVLQIARQLRIRIILWTVLYMEPVVNFQIIDKNNELIIKADCFTQQRPQGSQ